MANRRKNRIRGISWGMVVFLLSISFPLGAEVLAVLVKDDHTKVLAGVNPVTGFCFPRFVEVPMGPFSGGVAALDEAGGRLYLSANAPGETARRLQQLDATDGKVLGSPLIVPPTGVRGVPGFLVISDGSLLGIMDYSATTKGIFRINPATGSARRVGATFPASGYSGGVAAFDTKTHLLYLAARVNAGGPWRLLSFSNILGTITASSIIVPPPGYRDAPALLLKGEEAGVLGLLEHQNQPSMLLVSIDPSTGACVAIGSGFPAEGHSAGVGAFDVSGSQVFFPANAPGEGARRLFTIDSRTGAIVQAPLITAPAGIDPTPIAMAFSSAAAPSGPPGRVPDGLLPGVPLTVSKDPASPGGLRLTWGADCLQGGIDYAVYAGTLGSYYSHTGALCTTGGELTAEIPGTNGDRYYLIVPMSATEEGSYGTDSSMTERPAGSAACRSSQVINACP